MRYTTIIDLTEYPQLYQSDSVRLVYLHLVLRSGYHDHDRDLCALSLRRIAKETGLTVSAVRCALHRLTKAQMVVKQGTLWYVRKFVMTQPITSRAKTVKQQKAIEVKAIEEQEHEERERRQQIEEQKRLNLRAQGKTSFMVWYESEMQKAEAGDPAAQETVKRNAESYAAHKAQFQKQPRQQP